MSQLDIVVPDGSMQEVVMDLFAKAGMPVTIEKKRTKEGTVGVDWINRVAFQRPQEIPHLLAKGYFDVAIVGEDWIANWGYEFPVLQKLPVGRAGNKPVKIVLAVDAASGLSKIEDFPNDAEVATEYVQLVERFIAGLGRSDIRVTTSFGNTEQKVKYGATAVVDVSESGDSMRDNKLEVIDLIMESQTVVVARVDSLANETKRPLIYRFAQLISEAYHQGDKRCGPYGDWPGDVG